MGRILKHPRQALSAVRFIAGRPGRGLRQRFKHKKTLSYGSLEFGDARFSLHNVDQLVAQIVESKDKAASFAQLAQTLQQESIFNPEEAQIGQERNLVIVKMDTLDPRIALDVLWKQYQFANRGGGILGVSWAREKLDAVLQATGEGEHLGLKAVVDKKNIIFQSVDNSGSITFADIFLNIVENLPNGWTFQNVLFVGTGQPGIRDPRIAALKERLGFVIGQISVHVFGLKPEGGVMQKFIFYTYRAMQA